MPAAAIGGIVAGVGSIASGVMGASAASDAADAQTAAASQANELQKYMYDTSREDQAPWREAGGAAVNYIAKILGIPGYSGTTSSGTGGGASSSVEKPNIENYRIAKTSTVEQIPIPEKQNPARPYYTGSGTGTEYDYDYARYNKDLQAYTDSLSAPVATSEPLDLTNVLRSTPGYQFQVNEGQKAIERSAAAKGGLLSGAAGKALTTYSQGVADQTYNNYLNSLMSVAGLGQSSANTTTSAGTSYANAASNNLLYSGNAKASGYINQANALTGGLSSGMNNYLLYSMLNKNGGLSADQADYAAKYFGWPR